MRLITLTIFAVLLLALSVPASADVGLADWCVNLNGNIDVCNAGAAPGGNANVNVSAFDPTLETAGPNTLGSITVTIGTGVQYAAVYMDYDVNYSTWGSFTDVGSVNGSPSGSQSYELADPNTSNIFSDFSGAGPLPNSNTVDAATCAANSPAYCDVSWALAESVFVDSTLYSGGVVTFTVSTTAPTSGFYLQQTNGITSDTIYLSDTVNLTPLGSPAPTPEPTSVLLLATTVVEVLVLRRRSSANRGVTFWS
jgi:hypothetical protein